MKRGLPCPVCNTHMSAVTKTVQWDGVIVRKRKCFNGHIFPTIEGVGGIDMLREYERQRRRGDYRAIKELP